MRRLRDFDITASSAFGARQKAVNLAANPVVEAFRFELAARPKVEGPFGKILVELVPEGEPIRAPVDDLIDVVRVPLHVRAEGIVGDGGRKEALLLDLTEEALRTLEREVGWSSAELYDIVETLRRDDDLGWIELDGVEKRDRKTGRRVQLFYEVRDPETAVWAIVRSPDGAELRRERLAHSPESHLLERLFPVRSAVVDGRRVVFRDRDREPLAAVELDA
jgi:hypothetical protein